VTESAAAQSSSSPSRVGDASVLLVEDDPSVAEIVGMALRQRGFAVDVVADGRAALDYVNDTPPDIVVLDLGLPDIDGIDVCRSLRRWYTNPILVLSADGAENRKIAALEEGADDYVTKPFSMGELVARVHVALRHQRALNDVTDPGLITVGDVVIDTSAHVLTVGGVPVETTRKEFLLLALLARHLGKVVTHSKLLSGVWGTEDGRPAGTTDSLRVHITQLRKKLGDGPQRPQLLTDQGVGYRLVLGRDP
jgi:two-component system KDP operon response regulator KdpE